MISETQLSTLLFIAAVIWGFALLLNGTVLTPNLFEPFSTVTGAVFLVLSIFNKWAWRWRIFHPWLISIPDLQGTWKGQMVTDWINPTTNDKAQTIEVYLVIRQSLSAIHMRLLTMESMSESLAGNISCNTDGVYVVAGTYRNTPKILLRDKSSIHHGSLLLNIQGEPPNCLEGEYWTDRNTKGEIKLISKSKNLHFNFESASKDYYVKKW